MKSFSLSLLLSFASVAPVFAAPGWVKLAEQSSSASGDSSISSSSASEHDATVTVRATKTVTIDASVCPFIDSTTTTTTYQTSTIHVTASVPAAAGSTAAKSVSGSSGSPSASSLIAASKTPASTASPSASLAQTTSTSVETLTLTSTVVRTTTTTGLTVIVSTVPVTSTITSGTSSVVSTGSSTTSITTDFTSVVTITETVTRTCSEDVCKPTQPPMSSATNSSTLSSSSSSANSSSAVGSTSVGTPGASSGYPSLTATSQVSNTTTSGIPTLTATSQVSNATISSIPTLTATSQVSNATTSIIATTSAQSLSSSVATANLTSSSVSLATSSATSTNSSSSASVGSFSDSSASTTASLVFNNSTSSIAATVTQIFTSSVVTANLTSSGTPSATSTNSSGFSITGVLSSSSLTANATTSLIFSSFVSSATPAYTSSNFGGNLTSSIAASSTSLVFSSSLRNYTSTSASSSATSSKTSVSPTVCQSQATASPTFDSICRAEPIPGCIPCEGQPGNVDNYCGLTIDTNYYNEWPKTCTLVKCQLDITNVTLAPDGVDRMMLVSNGKLPGDLIEANWGDTVEVTVVNHLQHNGSSIHFHGVRQLNTNEYDGVPSITQCPIPGNGGSMVYTWVAVQYGFTWYHSHYSIQAWEGVIGPLMINGPTTQTYDIDLGPVMFMDWSHRTVFSMFDFVERNGAPNMDNGLINGRNIFEVGNVTVGSRAEFVFTPGKKHLLHLVNTAINTFFAFSIDGHKMTVIQTDFVPVVPYTVDVLKMANGQRYTVIVEADQPVGDYWMRADPLTASTYPSSPPCSSTNTMDGNIKAIIHYDGSCGTPNSTATAHDNVCEDSDLTKFVPRVALNPGPASNSYSENVYIAQNHETTIYRWYLSGTTPGLTAFQADYGVPTLQTLSHNSSAYEGPLAIELPHANQWIYVIIESPVPLPHPIHLHGGDFYVLASGAFQSYTNQPLNLVNPPRRDVAVMPAVGFLVLGFITDNPGVWLMHCHIGWHVSMGFALQLIEQAPLAVSQISDQAGLDKQCSDYNAFARGNIFQEDSGV